MELGGTEEWTSGRVVSMVDVTGGFLGGRGVGVAGSGASKPGEKSLTSHLYTPFLATESLPTEFLVLRPSAKSAILLFISSGISSIG